MVKKNAFNNDDEDEIENVNSDSGKENNCNDTNTDDILGGNPVHIAELRKKFAKVVTKTKQVNKAVVNMKYFGVSNPNNSNSNNINNKNNYNNSNNTKYSTKSGPTSLPELMTTSKIINGQQLTSPKNKTSSISTLSSPPQSTLNSPTYIINNSQMPDVCQVVPKAISTPKDEIALKLHINNSIITSDIILTPPISTGDDDDSLCDTFHHNDTLQSPVILAINKIESRNLQNNKNKTITTSTELNSTPTTPTTPTCDIDILKAPQISAQRRRREMAKQNRAMTVAANEVLYINNSTTTTTNTTKSTSHTNKNDDIDNISSGFCSISNGGNNTSKLILKKIKTRAMTLDNNTILKKNNYFIERYEDLNITKEDLLYASKEFDRIFVDL